MKRYLSFFLCGLVAYVMVSCVATKDYSYMYDVAQQQLNNLSIENKYDLRIKPADDLLIKVTDKDGQLLQVFSQATVIMGTSGVTGGNFLRAAGISSGYVVDGAGYLKLPLIGSVHVAGLTQEEAARTIEKYLVDKGILAEPHISVGILSGSVTVIGDITGPGVYYLESARTTIFDILAKAGGDVEGANIRKVQLFRENNGMRSMYELDLTNSQVLSSPAYYVQQNDMVYVYPSKKHKIKSSSFYTGLTAFSAILGFVATGVGIYYLLK